MPLGRNQSRFAPWLRAAALPVAPRRAPRAPLGKWSERVGPKWTPRREQAISTVVPAFSFKCSHQHIIFLLYSLLSPLVARGLLSRFSPGCRVLGDLGFRELEKERASVWSALISVEKDLIVLGFWDHYLSFTFIKSVMRKLKIKGFVNWIPVWKEAPTRQWGLKLADGPLGTIPDLSIYLQLNWQKSCAEAWRGDSLWQSLRVSRNLQLCEPYNPSFARHSDLELLLKRKGGLLVESLPSAGRADAAEMTPGESFHLLVVHFLIYKEGELVLVLILFFFLTCCLL